MESDVDSNFMSQDDPVVYRLESLYHPSTWASVLTLREAALPPGVA